MGNPMLALHDLGQSLWLDDLHRSLITSGELTRMIEEDALCGLSSNPTIFEKAMDESDEYQDMLEAPESEGIDSKTLYERIAVRDVQEAADVFRPVHLTTRGRDGYVSLEVSPRLARDPQGTLSEARRLWQMVARENALIKIPGTPEMIPVIQQLISEGINLNITLIFTQRAYGQVAMAYLGGLESLAQAGGDLSKVASVASIPIRGLDAAIEAWIAERRQDACAPKELEMLAAISGHVAVANAKLLYQKYREILSGDRWQSLCLKGAEPQRLAWISTAMIDPEYSDVYYAEALIGPDTINAMAPDTFASFRDHGHARATLTEGLEEAQRILGLLVPAGIPFEKLTEKLLTEGVDQFEDAFAKLLHTTNRGSKHSSGDPVTFLRMKLFKEFYKGRQLT